MLMFLCFVLVTSHQECNGLDHKWTEWYNTDSPDGDGDLELVNLSGNFGCRNPQHVQVETLNGTPYDQTGQLVHLNTACFGFMCLNKEQPFNHTCMDYRIRLCCKHETIETTTSISPTTTMEQTLSQNGSTINICPSFFEILDCSNTNGLIHIHDAFYGLQKNPESGCRFRYLILKFNHQIKSDSGI